MPYTYRHPSGAILFHQTAQEQEITELRKANEELRKQVAKINEIEEKLEKLTGEHNYAES